VLEFSCVDGVKKVKGGERICEISKDGHVSFYTKGTYLNKEKGPFISIFADGGFKIGHSNDDAWKVKHTFTTYYPDGTKVKSPNDCAIF